jgi:hypothetical protein
MPECAGARLCPFRSTRGYRIAVERMGKIEVDDSNRRAYRELESAGIVLIGRPFVGEPRYHLTRAGYEMKLELIACQKEAV